MVCRKSYVVLSYNTSIQVKAISIARDVLEFSTYGIYAYFRTEIIGKDAKNNMLLR